MAGMFSEKGDLREKHEDIDGKRTCPYGKTENFTDDVGYAGNRCRSQLSIGYHGDAVTHEKQTEKENHPALAAFSGL